jgi:WD40 repeat protein
VTPDIVKLWDLFSGRLLRTLPATSGFYSDTVAFSPDGTLVATAGFVGPIEIWRVSDGGLVTTIPYGTSVHNVHFDSSGTRLIAGGVNRVAAVWAIPSGAEMMTLPDIADEMADAVFSPDDSEIATTGPGNSVVIWDGKTGAVLQRLLGHALYVSHVVWVGPDRVVSNDWGGTIRTWTRTDGAFRQSGKLETSGQSLGIAVAPDQQTVVAGGVDPDGAAGFVFFHP